MTRFDLFNRIVTALAFVAVAVALGVWLAKPPLTTAPPEPEPEGVLQVAPGAPVPGPVLGPAVPVDQLPKRVEALAPLPKAAEPVAPEPKAAEPVAPLPPEPVAPLPPEPKTPEPPKADKPKSPTYTSPCYPRGRRGLFRRW